MSMYIQSEVSRMRQAARELAADGILNDPSDDVILVAAAELAGVNTDLARLDTHSRQVVINSFDQCARVIL